MEINSTAVIVRWNEPNVTNGIITMYEILYSLGNHSVLDDNATVISVTATVNTSYEIIIGGLDHFTVYSVAVRAYTRIGAGNLTDTFNILTDPFSKYATVNANKSYSNSIFVYDMVSQFHINEPQPHRCSMYVHM